jgi:hypothetical protein
MRFQHTLHASVEYECDRTDRDSIMLTKVAFGLAFVLASASVLMAATNVQPRAKGRKASPSSGIHRPAPTVMHPAECDPRVLFPPCPGAAGGGY